MRICQLSHVETTFNFLAPLFAALAEDGHEVVAASNMDQDGRVLRHHLGEAVELHRVRVSRKVTPQAFSTEIIELARYLARERFDVLHLHGPLAAVQGRLAARLARVPVVISHAHGFYFHDNMRPLARRAHVAMERGLGRTLTDYIITVNRDDTAFARRHRFIADPERVIATPGVGIDTLRFAPKDPSVRRAIRRELGVPDDELVVTFVGRLVAEKGVLDLAAAFAAVLADRPAWLWLVGGVSLTERDQEALRHLDEVQRADADTAARTIRLGQRTDVPDVLAATDIFVLPSYREGMPVSLLEAMACQVPVVTTEIRGCREAVAGGRAGILVAPGDAAALGEALRKLAADPEERARLGKAGRREVLEHYTVERALAPVVALYRRIAASRTTTAGSVTSRVFSLARRVLPTAVRAKLARSPKWRIAVEHVDHPTAAIPTRTELALSEAQLAEQGIAFVADPFAVHRDGTWHLFFEQVRIDATRGEIGLATSTDLRAWTYRGVVLAEPFHLSYPKVLAADGQLYMMPEANESGSVRLYRAVAFPARWELCDVLLDGMPFKDSTPFEHDGRWYLLSETSRAHTHDELRLYDADGLRGPWAEHPASPLVVGNADAARPAGSVVLTDGRLHRFSQRCGRRYGEGLRGHVIDMLTPTEFRESSPAGCGLQPRPGEWNALAVHHIDAHRVPGGWVRFIDGYR